MAPKVETLVLAFLMLLMVSLSLGLSGEFDGSDAKPLFHKISLKDGEGLKVRKLMMDDSHLDYGEVGPNPKHSPPPGKKGCENAP